jgi:phenylalanyl-tRNA synthetase beta chain
MRVPLSWLRDYVALEMPVADLAARLDMSTAVVAAVDRLGVPDEGENLGFFRVGKVLDAGKHPNADRCGSARSTSEANRTRSCGAWNFGAGATVRRSPGATLPGGLVLERRKLRGEMSEDDPVRARARAGAGYAGIIVLDDGEAGSACRPAAQDVVLDLEIWATAGSPLGLRDRARVAALYASASPPPGTIRLRRRAGRSRSRTTTAARAPSGTPADVRLGPSTWLRARLNPPACVPLITLST